jgi:hypothetical protein
MAVLNAWQRIDRVVPGKPFGNGSDGAYSSATIPTLTKDSCSGSGTTLTTSGSTFANGDILLIHQSRGSGVGQWEINKVSSGGGTASLTLSQTLNYTYTDSGASQAQAIKIPQYSSFTISGTTSITDWAGDTGGIFIAAVSGIASITGIISADSRGYDGGPGDIGSTGVSHGEGTQGPVVYWPSALQDTGGSGGGKGGGGGGGGHATSGGNGTGGYEPGYGGDAAGLADLTTMVFGGGGGSGASANEHDGDGAPGGGILFLIAKTITLTGSISNYGGTGENSSDGTGGGGGAGGSVLLVCQTATLGSNLIAATGGSGGTSPNGNGGAGSTGRIAIHYSNSYTGTTSPSFTDVPDTTLIETSAGGGASYAFFM